MLFVPAMPVVTLAGPEEDSMGRGGRARPRRQRLGEVDINGPVDLTDVDWWWLEGLPALGAAPPRGCTARGRPAGGWTPP